MTADRPTPATQPQFPTIQPAGSQSSLAAAARPPWQRALLGSGGIALALVVLAGGLLLAVFFAGAVASATEAAYRYVPDDAVYAIELRVDMPGDQREELVDFATGLPGLEGEMAIFEQITDALDDGLREIAGDDADYARDVAPWFEEWIVMAAPAPAEGQDASAGLLLLGVRDRAAAEEALPRLRGDADWSAQEYRGSSIWTTDEPREGLGAYVVLDDVLILASSANELREALDVAAGDQPSLLGEARFAEHWRGLPAGRLIAFWADAQALEELPRDLPGAMPMPMPFPSMPIDPLGGACAEELPQPDTLGGAVYLRDGRAHVDLTTRYAEGAELPANGDSRLAEHLPADTFVYASHRQIGDAATRLSECLAQSGVDAAEVAAEIEERLGSLDELLGWSGDGAFAARWDGSKVGVGAVVAVEDRQAAEAALADMRAKLSNGEHGEVTFTESTHAGVTVVEARRQVGPGEGEPGMPEPVLAWALTDELLIVGVDASFTHAVLDTTAATSLLNDAGFRGAIDAAGGASSTSVAYVDMQAAMAVAEAMELGRGSDQGDEEMLGALDTLVAVSRVDGRSVVTRVVITPAE